jgi:hypothetical protein
MDIFPQALWTHFMDILTPLRKDPMNLILIRHQP